jgi:hypothetical protein
VELALDRVTALTQENKDRSSCALKLTANSDEEIVAQVMVTAADAGKST